MVTRSPFLTPCALSTLANRHTRSCSSLYVTLPSVPGVSPSHRIATWSPRVFRCRSMQLAEMLRTPSSYHLIETFGYAKLVYLILVGALIQTMRWLCSFQNPSGSLIEPAYFSSYLALVMIVRALAASLGSKIRSSDIGFLQSCLCFDPV